MVGGLAAVVLAAGSATRFGSPKQLAAMAGEPLIVHVLQRVLASIAAPIVVVLGSEADAVRAVLPEDPRLQVVINHRYRDGLATSLVAGLDALSLEVVATAVVLGDVPAIEPRDIDAVLHAVRDGHEAARIRYQDGPGHPLAFGRQTWPRLRRVSGDAGARSVLRQLEVHELRVSRPRPLDVDRPEDLVRAGLPIDTGAVSGDGATR